MCSMQEGATGRISSYSEAAAAAAAAAARGCTRSSHARLTPAMPRARAVIGKAEGAASDWHGHVSALTVAPEFRRLGLAKTLMAELERVSDAAYRGFFVDLFVRVGNTVAVRMYAALGYSVYRRVLAYYGSGGGDRAEDAFDMRRALPRDVSGGSCVPLPAPVPARELA
jgi:N-terminal acetyltransferase B complex catalytic subunit